MCKWSNGNGQGDSREKNYPDSACVHTFIRLLGKKHADYCCMLVKVAVRSTKKNEITCTINK